MNAKSVIPSGKADDGEPRGKSNSTFASVGGAIAMHDGPFEKVVVCFLRAGKHFDTSRFAECNDVHSFSQTEQLGAFFRYRGANKMVGVDGEQKAHKRRADFECMDSGRDLIAH